MICPKCKQENPKEALFCMKCGTKLEKKCPNCGAEYPEEAIFCMKCGMKLIETDSSKEDMKAFRLEDVQEKPLIPETLRKQMNDGAREMEGENRLVTSIFADISGFTPMSQELSPEALVERVNQCFRVITDTIHRYEGSHNQFIGDCELAFFGAPLAHENDPERSILAALGMLKSVEKLGLSISVGINTGMAYFGTIGTGENQEISAYGADVNLAKRLQEKANPGQIIVGDSTYRLTRTIFNFNSLGLNTFKGIKTPVLIYEVLGVKEYPEKLRGIDGLPTRMIGREKEFTALIDCADALIKEYKGQIVTISGEAGIGKSRLVMELKEYLKNKNVQCLEGRCLSIGQTISFWPFIDIIQTYLGIKNEKDISSRLIMKIESLFGQEAENIIPYLGQMLSIMLDEKYQQRIRYAPPEQIRRQILLRTRDFFLKLAQEKPLLLIMEDMHWADELSLDLFYVLMDELPNAPILLLCVYRPERDHGSSKIDPVASSKYLDRYTRISLRALTQHETQQLLESLLEVDNLPLQIRSMILDKTEGNPFFIEEVIRLLIDQGMIYRENNRWKAKEAISEISVPETLQSVILSRIDTLQEAVKHVLQYASVIGRVFQRQLLCYISGQEEAIEQKLSQLEACELIYRERIVPELEYAFKHALTQEATYQQLLNQQRRIFHERIGEGIEAIYREQIEEYYERLAYHYSRSDNKKKAINYLVMAGQKSAGQYANQTALNYFQQALERIEIESADYYNILECRAKILLSMFRGKAAADDYRILIENARHAGNQNKELDFMLNLAYAYYITALEEPDLAAKSFELYKQAYSIARELDDKESMIRSLIMPADLQDFGVGNRSDAIASIEEALSISREIENEELLIDSMIAKLRFRNLLGVKTQAEKLVEELINKIKPRHDLIKLKETYFRAIWIYLTRGNFKKCLECCDASIQIAEELGALPVMYPGLKAIAFANIGEFDKAWESLQREVTAEGHRFGIAFNELAKGLYLFELMAYDMAIETFEKAIEQASLVKRWWIINWAQHRIALCLLRKGQLNQDKLDIIIQNPASTEAKLPLDVLAEIALCEGKLNEALQLAEEYCSLVEVGGGASADTWPGYSSDIFALELKLRVLLSLNRASEVLALSAVGIQMAEESDCLPMQWRIRAAKAQALEILGCATDARQEYQIAAKIIHKLADNISNEELRRIFLSSPLVSSISVAVKCQAKNENKV